MVTTCSSATYTAGNVLFNRHGTLLMPLAKDAHHCV